MRIYHSIIKPVPWQHVLALALLCCMLVGNAEAEEQENADDAALRSAFEAEKEKPSSASAQMPNPVQLDIMAAADLVGAYDKARIHTTRNEINVRSMEIGFSAIVDQVAQGTILMAAHNENGQVIYDIHEISVLIPNLLPNVNVRVGRFFLDAGRLNSVHQHDWPFTTAPLVHQALLAPEGVADTGLEAKILMPWPFWQELTIGIFNGRVYGHAHEDGAAKKNPMVVMHLKQFLHLGGSWGTQLGFTYMRWNPTENPHQYTEQAGVDWVVKWREGRSSSLQWLTEGWYRQDKPRHGDDADDPKIPMKTQAGFYSFLEYQFVQNWFAGLRLDFFNEPTLRNAERQPMANGTVQSLLQLTYKPSEFSFYRISAAEKTDRSTMEKSYDVQLQATFMLGKHPSHVY